MSRLDSVIRRLSAQRDCLGWAVDRAPEGPFLEIGLGNGRTYHHMREIAPERSIWVIDRNLNAHPSSIPPDAFYLEGDAETMIARLAERIGPTIALAHYDIGFGVPEIDDPLGTSVATVLPRVLAPDALIVSNRLLDGFEALPVPASVPKDRYFMQKA